MKYRRENHAYIKIRKVQRFATCSICKEFDEKIGRSTGAKRKFLLSEKNKHIEWQYRERDEETKHHFKAQRNPDKYMFMSIDGMDNAKTDLFKFAAEDKKTDQATKFPTHLTGVVMAGRPVNNYVYTWYDRFPSGSDSVITVLLKCLHETAKKAPLPPVLYLHLDNCSRENKNR